MGDFTTALVTGGLAVATGGASLAAGAGLSSSLLLGATTGLSVLSQVRQGEAAEVTAKQVAESEKQAAIDSTIERKRRLIRSLAQQNVSAGARGVQLSGSEANIQRADIAAAETDTAIAAGRTSARVSQALSQGKFAKQASLLSAGASVARGAARVSRISPKKKD